MVGLVSFRPPASLGASPVSPVTPGPLDCVIVLVSLRSLACGRLARSLRRGPFRRLVGRPVGRLVGHLVDYLPAAVVVDEGRVLSSLPFFLCHDSALFSDHDLALLAVVLASVVLHDVGGLEGRGVRPLSGHLSPFSHFFVHFWDF